MIITGETRDQINNIRNITSKFTSDILYSVCNLTFEFNVRYKEILTNITFATTGNRIFNLLSLRRKQRR